MSKSRKVRSDSKLAALDYQAQQDLGDVLCAGASLLDACEWLLAHHGIAISQQSLSEYYRRHILTARWRRQEQVAQVLSACKSEHVSEAAHKAVAQTVYEYATSPDAEPKVLASLYNLLLKRENLAHDTRKLAVLEAKAASAKRELEQVVGDSESISPEAMARIQAAFNNL